MQESVPPPITLRSGALVLDVSAQGGAILGFAALRGHGRVDLMRDGRAAGGDPLAAACFPLVPFGNRVSSNAFVFRGERFTLHPNQAWDRHYLHGDGWLSRWEVEAAGAASLVLCLHHQAAGTPYSYAARQVFTLVPDQLTLTLSVTNAGPIALPFGLGWHPYFPLTEETRLGAPAVRCTVERDAFLPGEETEIPGDLDFSKPRRLPRHWVNNSFSGWDRTARIIWPERNAALRVEADPIFGHYVVFVSDPSYEPGYAHDYFCFEPMTHAADGHNRSDLGGLRVLEPGESLSAALALIVDVPA